MADTPQPFLGITNFGQPVDSPTVAAKKDSVTAARDAKATVLGSQQDLFSLALAEQNGNRAGQDEVVQDLGKLTYGQLSRKYGREVADNAHRYNTEYLRAAMLDVRERSRRQVVGDTANDLVSGVLGLVETPVALGLVAVDQQLSAPSRLVNRLLGDDVLPEPPALSPIVSELMGQAQEGLAGMKSGLQQERNERHAIEGAHNQADSAALHAEQLASGMGETEAWFRKFGRDVRDGVGNYLDDPSMVGQVAAQGASTLVPQVAAIRAIGAARAMKALSVQGMTREAAMAHLKTSAGRAFLNKEMMGAVGLVTAVTEGGSAVTQAQQEILALSEEDLADNAAYKDLRAKNLSHDEALSRMARDGGAVAGLIGAAVGVVTSRIGQGFEVNPLALNQSRSGAAAAIAAGLSNIGKETVEEGLQEGSNQLASIAGQIAVGLDQSLDEGLGASVADGLIGGALVAGGMQAAPVALGALNESAKATARAADSAVRAREASIARQEDAASPVGSAAQAEAADRADAAAQSILNHTTPSQIEASPEEKAIKTSVNEALYITEQEYADQAENFPRLAEERSSNPDKPVSRALLVEEAGKVLKDGAADPSFKLNAAVAVMESMDRIRSAERNSTTAALDRLPEDHPMRGNAAELSQEIQTISSSKSVQAAQDYIAALTPESLNELPFMQAFNAGALPEEANAAVAETLAVIGKVNPTAVSLDQYNTALNQLGNASPQLKASLSTARDTAQIAQEADAARAVIETEQDEVIEEAPAGEQAELKGKRHRTHDLVREDIHETGNENNGMPSLKTHRLKFMTAVGEGKFDAAQDALTELRRFAQSQVNKVLAYNASAEEGKGKPRDYQAYGPFGWLPEGQKAYANTRSLKSVGLAKEAWVDTKSLVDAHNSLLAAYGEVLGDLNPELAAGVLETPALHASISFQTFKGKAAEPKQTAPQQTETVTAEAVPKPERRLRKDAVLKTGESLIDYEDTSEASQEPAGSVPEQSDNAEDLQNDGQSTETSPQDNEGAQEADLSGESDSLPEAAAEGDGASEPVKRASLQEIFGEALIKTREGANRFLEAFQRKGQGSSFLDHDDAAQFLTDNTKFLHKVAGNSLDTPLTPEQVELLQAVLGGDGELSLQAVKPVVDKMIQELFDKEKRVGPEKRITTRLKELLAGDERGLSFPETLTGNLTTQDEDGKLVLDPQIYTAAFMGTLQWLTEESNRGDRRSDDEQVNQIFGFPRTHRTTRQMRDAAALGTPAQAAMEGIARNFTELLGVSGRKDALENLTQGIPLALAGTMLEAFSDAGLIDLNKVSGIFTGKETKPRDLVVMAIPEKGNVAGFGETFKSKPDIFSRAFDPAREAFRHIGKPPQSTPNHVIRNKLRKLSGKERKVVDRLQKTPYRLNTPLLHAFGSMGPDNVLRLLGWQPLDEDRMNRNTLASQKGKNRSLQDGYKAVMGYYHEMQEYAAEHGMPLEEVEAFFGMEISSVGRLQQQGPVTPQGDKIARELLTATNATLDLTNPDQEQLHWLAVAQSLDVSIEKLQPEAAIAEAKTRALEHFAPAVDLLRDLDKRLADDPEAELNLEEQTALAVAIEAGSKAADTPITVKALHALHVVARAENALAAENPHNRENFRTSLAIEADGKTDGPINALIHMATGPFTPHQIRIWEKGGLFFTSEPVTLNDHIVGSAFRAADKEDLYHVAAGIFDRMLPEFLTGFNEPTEKLASAAVMDALNSLLDGFQMGTPTSRNVLKNPLTVFLYGSGSKGIAQKVVNAAMDRFYTEMTNAAAALQGGDISRWQDYDFFADNPQMLQAVEALMNIEVKKVKGRKVLSRRAAMLTLGRGDPRSFTLPSEGEGNMVDLIDMFFAEPMMEALDEATGGLVGNMKLLQRASQIQAAVFTDKFNQLLEAKREEKGLGKSELLSREETEEVFQAAMEVAPIYGTDVQSFHIAAPGRQLADRMVSESSRGTLPARAKVQHPSDASVKVQPYMVIGMGDGRMMINIYADGDGSLNATLPVFDGVELATDIAVNASRQINRAVWDAWMDGNIMEAVADGFDQLVLKKAVSGVQDLEGSGLAWSAQLGIYALTGEWPDTIDHDGVENFVRDTAEELRAGANEIKARKQVMASVATRTDHMAGLRAAHTHEGEDLGVPSHVDAEERYRLISRALNRRLGRTEKAAETRDDNAPAVQKPTKEFEKAVRSAGQTVDGYDATMISGDRIAKLLTHQTGGSNDQTKIFHELLKGQDRFEGITVYTGSPEELTRLRDDLGYQSDHPVELGQAFVGDRVLFVANPAPETLLHELLHVYTYRQLKNHYDGLGDVPAAMKGAIGRLEHLYREFWKLDVSQEPQAVQDAFRQMQRQLQDPTLGKAERMTEFLSWTLSNQNLIGLGKKVRTTSPVLRILQDVMEVLRKILRVSPGSTLHSHIRFNADILIAYSGDRPTVQHSLMEQSLNTALDQQYGTSPQLEQVERQFLGKLDAHIAAAGAGKDRVGQAALDQATAHLRQATNAALNHVVSQGFYLNPREAQAFRAVHSAMLSGARMDSSAMSRLNALYGHVLKNMTPDTFLTDPETASNEDQSLARMRLGVLTGDAGVRKDKRGRTDLLATFTALSQVSPEFREALAKLDAPKDVVDGAGSIDGFLRNVASSVVNLLTRASLNRVDAGRDVQQQLDVLGQVLSEVKGERRLLAMMQSLSPVGRVNDFLTGQLEEKGSAAFTRLNTVVGDETRGKTVRGAAAVGQFITALASKQSAEAFGDAATRMLNEHPNLHTARRLLADLRGMTAANKELMRLLNPVKAQVDAARQDFREMVPEILARKFSRKLSKDEWSRLFTGIGRADILALGQKEALTLMQDPDQAAAAIQKAEAEVRKLGGRDAALFLPKAEALAEYMISRNVTSQKLLRNAKAIAELSGEGEPRAASKELVQAIDRLVSLYAFQKLDDATKASLKELAETEGEGMNTLIGYHGSLRKAELSRLPEGDAGNTAAYNAWKGYVPSVQREGVSLVVAEDTKSAEMSRMGYTRVGDYKGDANEHAGSRRGYYLTAVSARNAFRQGVAQTVHSTYQGVDVRSGRTQGGLTAGAVFGTEAQRIRKRLGTPKDGLKAGEHLMPVFDEKGRVKGYERPLSAEMLAMVPQDTHLGRMLGVWGGRMVEEKMGNEFNHELVGTIKAAYDKRDPGSDNQFVNVADPKVKDPVIRDAWATLGWQIKQDAAEAFGQSNFFPVRRDMLEDAIGYRAASITDPWTGISRWSPETQKRMRDAATLILGKDAFKYLRHGSNAVEDTVSYAKTTIIVRAVTVAWENIISNLGHLLIHGIDPLTLVKGSRDKFVEVTNYVKNRERIQELQVELAANAGKAYETKRIKAEMQALEDANERLSIAPLIRAGEFSTVSENLTEADVAIREGRFSDFMEKVVDKLPGKAKEVGSNVLITKDSAVFQGLNRMVQYGDFVAKAVLYDHLKKKGERTEREILDEISEEFVNYNRLAGRGRDFLESMGLLWFYNYKLRIQKIALKTMREKPFTSLTLGMGTLPQFDIDTVMSGSLSGAILDGRVGYSVGPEMGLNSWSLHPVANLVD